MVSSMGTYLRRRTRREACEELADLLTRELSRPFTPEEIDGLFERRWSQLSLLAHAIHDGYVPPQTAEAYSGRIEQDAPP